MFDVIHQCIRLNEFYKLIESFFEFVFGFLAKNRIFSKQKRDVNINQIAICYISMDSCQRALQTNEKLFWNSKLVFVICAKNRKIFKWIEKREYWSKWNVPISYVSMDLTRQDLQTNVKLFSNFWIIYWISYNFFK